uniref:MFS transporter n=1 Tax=Thermorudis peleae TaxID=1382356 RepID=A0A831X778_9BACT
MTAGQGHCTTGPGISSRLSIAIDRLVEDAGSADPAGVGWVRCGTMPGQRERCTGSGSASGMAVEHPKASVKSGILHSLQVYPGFRVLFFTTVATNASFWMWQLVIGWLALVLTDSPFFVGLVGFLGGIPMLLVSLPAGVVIDQVDRRLVLLLAQVSVTLVVAAVTFMFWRGWLAPWHLLVGVFLAGTAMSFVFPTRNAMVADLVERNDLANAVALNSAGQNAPRVIGPALAGPLALVIGDLSFYHDMNGLFAARRHGLRATIVLLNNDGGGIFSFLPQAEHGQQFERLFGTPHGLDFRHAAALYGLSFTRVESWPAFREAVRASLAGDGVSVIEVPTERARNVELHRRIWPAVAQAVRGVVLPALSR